MADIFFRLGANGRWVNCAESNATHRVSADNMEALAPPLPADLAALVGVLPDEEIQLLVRKRAEFSTLAAIVANPEPTPVENEPEPAPPPAPEPVPAEVITNTPPRDPIPPCPVGKAGRHTPARYALRADGTVSCQCKCGRWFDNVKCPHMHQSRAGRNIICAWCHKVIIANTQSGVDVMGEAERAHRTVDQLVTPEVMHTFDGNADG